MVISCTGKDKILILYKVLNEISACTFISRVLEIHFGYGDIENAKILWNLRNVIANFNNLHLFKNINSPNICLSSFFVHNVILVIK